MIGDGLICCRVGVSGCTWVFSFGTWLPGTSRVHHEPSFRRVTSTVRLPVYRSTRDGYMSLEYDLRNKWGTWVGGDKRPDLRLDPDLLTRRNGKQEVDPDRSPSMTVISSPVLHLFWSDERVEESPSERTRGVDVHVHATDVDRRGWWVAGVSRSGRERVPGTRRV